MTTKVEKNIGKQKFKAKRQYTVVVEFEGEAFTKDEFESLDKSKEEPIPKADNSSPSIQLNTVDLDDWDEDPEPSAIITLPYRSITLQCK